MGVYEELGVRPLINAWGTITRVGGSRMHPDVLEAMREASLSFVDMHELHSVAGESIAKLLGVPAACVTSGAAAGLAIAAAACMARSNPSKILELPDTGSMRNEALVLKSHRILYDQGLRLSGARFVEIGVTSYAAVEQIEEAITDRTAMFFYSAEAVRMRGSLALDVIARLLKPHGIPIIVDAAAELPPSSNVTAFLEAGANLVVFSGGKELRGPQSSGLILGSEHLISHCDANSFPNYGVGRSMKTDKETIVGLVKAVELFVRRDYGVIRATWDEMVDTMVAGLGGTESITIRRGFPTQAGVQPADVARAYIQTLNNTALELQAMLRDGSPSVAVGVEGTELVLNPQCLEWDEIEPLVLAVKKALSSE